MNTMRSLHDAAKPRRWAKLVLIAGVFALLAGCVVEPVGYYGPRGGYYGGYYYGHGYWR
jgi:hypothetical protein